MPNILININVHWDSFSKKDIYIIYIFSVFKISLLSNNNYYESVHWRLNAHVARDGAQMGVYFFFIAVYTKVNHYHPSFCVGGPETTVYLFSHIFFD